MTRESRRSGYSSNSLYGSSASSRGRSAYSQQSYGYDYSQGSPSSYGQPASSQTPGARFSRSQYTQPAGMSNYPAPERSGGSHGVLSLILVALISLAVGIGGTFFVLSLQPKVLPPVGSVISASDLDSVVGYYTYDGSTYEITAEQAILSSIGLESMKVASGYRVPSADMILAYAQNQILARLVADNGITVSGEDVLAYANDVFGTSDFDYIASYLNMTPAQAQTSVSEAAAVRKLRQSVLAAVGGSLVPPALPADGNTEVGSPYYANYIIQLLGPYWSTAAGTWADTVNPYYATLSSMVFAPDSASYDAAQAAYAIAFEQAVGVSSADVWADYLNQYLGAGSVSIATLAA